MKFLSISIVVIYFLLVLLGIIQFELWGQVEYLNATIDSVNSILSYESINEGHNLRYLLVYPVYLIENYTGINRHNLFSFYVLLILLVSSYYFSKVLYLMSNLSMYASSTVSLMFFMTLSIFMNGRITFALLSITLMLYLVAWKYCGIRIKSFKTVVYVYCAILLASVSSGTFSVIYVIQLIFALWIILNIAVSYKTSINEIFMLAILLSAPTVFAPLFSENISRNLQFYDESILKMLDHGFGRYLSIFISEYFVLFVMLLILFIGTYLIIVLTAGTLKPLLIMLLITTLGGVFGYSTLTLALPLLLLIIIAQIFKPKYKSFKRHVITTLLQN